MPVHADPTKKRLRVNERNEKVSEQRSDQDPDLRWWIGDEADAHERVFMVTSRIEENMSGRRRQNYLHALMYQDVDPVAVYGYNADQMDRTGEFGASSRITLNVVQNAIDTLSSMVAKNRPKPMFLTDGADYKTRVKAQKLTKYVSGVIDDASVYQIAERVFTDACIYGTGAIKFWIDSESQRVRADWVFIGEILVDDLEGMREKPSQLHQRKFMSRDELCSMFPGKAEKIWSVNTDIGNSIGGRAIADVIPVIESWHLPSGPKAKDGLHSIAIEDCTLLWEEYAKDYYPIQFFRLYHSTLGFWGRGVCHAIGRIQRTINKLLRVIDKCQDLVGEPYWVVAKTAMVNFAQLESNEIGRIIEYFGDPTGRPEMVTPEINAPEMYQHVWALEQRAYNVVGVNQNMAQGEKQPGVESAVGQREATDTAQGRFQVVSQRWENWFTDLAHVIVDLSKDLDDPEINVDDNGVLRRIRWADVDLEKDKFKIAVYQVSGLPQSPTGRLETLSMLKDQGLIDNEWFMKLLDLPDLRSMTNLETATTELTLAILARIKETGKMDAEDAPLPEMNLPQAKTVCAKEIVLAKLQGVEEDTLQLMSAWGEQVSYLIQGQAPAAPPVGGPPPMGPGGPPGMGGAPPGMPPGPPGPPGPMGPPQ